jgi:hypothetical protein
MSEPSITCPQCGMTSHNPNDVREGYCGNCHDWTGAIRELVPHNHLGDGMYWDRRGNEITLARWTLLHGYGENGNRWDYTRIGYDELTDKDGKTKIRVSTIWEGIASLAATVTDFRGPLGTFETMVFINGEPTWRDKYSSEAEARQQHDTLVRSLRLVGADFLRELQEHDG